jgi:hypothetical protein
MGFDHQDFRGSVKHGDAQIGLCCDPTPWRGGPRVRPQFGAHAAPFGPAILATQDPTGHRSVSAI